MRRGELLVAIAGIDREVGEALLENSLFRGRIALDHLFPPDDCDFELAQAWQEGQFDAVAAIATKEVLDIRACGHLLAEDETRLIADTIADEYAERGKQTLPNGFPLRSWNVVRMLAKPEGEEAPTANY